MPSDLSEPLIDASLRGTFGRPFQLLDVTDSTNERALEWMGEGAPEGALVVAEQQTAGRGRRGRTWESRPGDALLFSLVLRPSGPAEVVELLTTTLGVACAEGIAEVSGLDAGLKWPNDVMAGEAKLAGILVESRVSGGSFGGAVAGIGINVRWPQGDEGRDFATPATSLAAEASSQPGVSVPGRAELLGAVVSSFEDLYTRLEDPETREDVRRRASDRSTILGREVTVRFGDGSVVEGRARELTASGALVLDAGGSSTILGVGEIERIRPS